MNSEAEGNSPNYYLFRHALAEHGENYGLRFFSDHISSYGRATTQRLADYLQQISIKEGFSYDGFYQSPLRRCRETALIVSERIGLSPKTDLGLIDRLLEPEILLRRRVERSLIRIYMTGQRQVVICTHEAILSSLVSILTESNHPTFRYKYPTGVLTLVRNSRIFECQNFNTGKYI